MKTQQTLSRIFAICDQVAATNQPIRTESQGKEAARVFLGESSSVNIKSGCLTWNFEYILANFGRERLESGRKLCENKGCGQLAVHLVQGALALSYACDHCLQLIPDATVIKSNK